MALADEISRLRTVLVKSRVQTTNPALYQTIETLIRALESTYAAIQTLTNRINSLPSTQGGTGITSITLEGEPDYITVVGSTITRHLIDLLTDIQNRLPFANLIEAPGQVLVGAEAAGNYGPVALGANLGIVAGILDTIGSGLPAPTDPGDVLALDGSENPAWISPGGLELGAAKWCYVYRSTDQVIPDTVLTLLSYDTEIVDHGDLWNIATPTAFVLPIAGQYLVHVNVEWESAVGGFFYVTLKKNGVAVSKTSLVGLGGTSGYTGQGALTTIVRTIADNEYLEIEVQWLAGGLGTVNAKGAANRTYVQIASLSTGNVTVNEGDGNLVLNITEQISNSDVVAVPSIVIVHENSPAALDLTTEGTEDWFMLNAVTDNTPPHRANQSYKFKRNGLEWFLKSFRWMGAPDNTWGTLFTYNSGTNHSTSGNDDIYQDFSGYTTGVAMYYQTQKINYGYKIILPADPGTRILRLYSGVYNGTIQLKCELSDGTTPVTLDLASTSGGSTGKLWKVTYNGARYGQWMIVTMRVTARANAVDWTNISFTAATLTKPTWPT